MVTMFPSARWLVLPLLLVVLPLRSDAYSILPVRSSSSSTKKTFLTTLRMGMTATTASSASDSKTLSSNNKMIEFRKYHGLGNDFILIDNRQFIEPSLSPQVCAQLCDRNFGIGADGVIFALQSQQEHSDFNMRIFNSDGSEPEMCGNGIRCLAQFLHDLGEEKSSYTVETLAGPIVPVVNKEQNTITVDMGPPILKAKEVPTTLTPNFEGDSVVEQDYTCPITGKNWKISCVSMGNPHAIIFVQDLERDVDLLIDGPALETASIFPAKTNVEFVQVLSPTHLKMKVWERGAGPTLACGTGTCALVVAAMRAGKIPRSSSKPIKVTLPGGDLWIEWKDESDDFKVYMTGPATFAFAGTAPVPST